MPIFKKNFGKKSAKVRESRLVENIDDFKNITLKLSDKNTLKFVDGVWLVLKKNQLNDNMDDAAELLKSNQQLREENSMTMAKMDILLDLLSETLSGTEMVEKKILN